MPKDRNFNICVSMMGLQVATSRFKRAELGAVLKEIRKPNRHELIWRCICVLSDMCVARGYRAS